VISILNNKYDWFILLIIAIFITFQEVILNIRLGYFQTFIFAGILGAILYGMKFLIIFLVEKIKL